MSDRTSADCQSNKVVQRKAGKRTCFREQRCEVGVGLRIPFKNTTTSRRPDLTLEDKQKKTIWICDMACPQERNIETKMNDKRTKCQQLAFEIRERRKEYKVVVVPIIIGCLGGGVDKTIREVQ